MFDRSEAEAGRLRIKICGICNETDARAAIALGADAIGLNGYRQSRRYLDLARSAEWIAALPGTARKVAVLVDPPWEEALAIARLAGIDGLQLHGTETPEFCARLAGEGIRIVKAIPVINAESLAALPSFATDILVLDSAEANIFGGSGKTFPWDLARRFVEAHPERRVILAGGLTPGNVADAIRQVRPYGVDVTSGVESSPARKDHALLRAFIEAARAAL